MLDEGWDERGRDATVLGAIHFGKRRTSLFQKGLRIHLLVIDLGRRLREEQEQARDEGRQAGSRQLRPSARPHDEGERTDLSMAEYLLLGRASEGEDTTRVAETEARRRGGAGARHQARLWPGQLEPVDGRDTHYLWRFSSLDSGMKGAMVASGERKQSRWLWEKEGGGGEEAKGRVIVVVVEGEQARPSSRRARGAAAVTAARSFVQETPSAPPLATTSSRGQSGSKQEMSSSPRRPRLGPPWPRAASSARLAPSRLGRPPPFDRTPRRTTAASRNVRQQANDAEPYDDAENDVVPTAFGLNQAEERVDAGELGCTAREGWKGRRQRAGWSPWRRGHPRVVRTKCCAQAALDAGDGSSLGGKVGPRRVRLSAKAGRGHQISTNGAWICALIESESLGEVPGRTRVYRPSSDETSRSCSAH